ncbi:glutathione S-transferase Mu 4-like isoform X2 [Dipodomys merriami]|uniref:glutathione S-transferase Mu 4-like isoform X2 n=1 Tax=Dipodomys merriami TaxID=94247 RepID=UPI003855ACF0
MPMTLGYWDIRGLAHAIHLLLEYTDTSYKEKRYTMGDAPDYDRSQWLSEKFKLGLDFPNLPYLIDGAHKITQSNAILRYIAHKHNLCEWLLIGAMPNTVETGHSVREFVGEGSDSCFLSQEKLKLEYLEQLPGMMKLFSEFLGKQPWFVGDKGLKKISAYMKSSHFLPTPLYTKVATWGNK